MLTVHKDGIGKIISPILIVNNKMGSKNKWNKNIPVNILITIWFLYVKNIAKKYIDSTITAPMANKLLIKEGLNNIYKQNINR